MNHCCRSSLFRYFFTAAICFGLMHVQSANADVSCFDLLRSKAIIQASTIQPESGFGDAYAVLGVSPDSSMGEIKSAYRALANRYHADRNSDPTAIKKMQLINEAYDFIKKAARAHSASEDLLNQFADVFSFIAELRNSTSGKVTEAEMIWQGLANSIAGWYQLVTAYQSPPSFLKGKNLKGPFRQWMASEIERLNSDDFERLNLELIDSFAVLEKHLPPRRSSAPKEEKLARLALEDERDNLALRNLILAYGYYSSPRSLERPDILKRLLAMDTMGENTYGDNPKLAIAAAILIHPHIANSKAGREAMVPALSSAKNLMLSYHAREADGLNTLGDVLMTPPWREALAIDKALARSFADAVEIYTYKVSRLGAARSVVASRKPMLIKAWLTWKDQLFGGKQTEILHSLTTLDPGLVEAFK